MAEFLQNYGVLIFLGLFMLLMFRGRGRGMGCGMGGREHSREESGEERMGNDRTDTGHRSSGCH